MKIKGVVWLFIVIGFGSVISPASFGAPALEATASATCTITKVGNGADRNSRYSAVGTAFFSANNKSDYKLNGYDWFLTNQSGSKTATSGGKISIPPTSSGDTRLFSFDVDYTYARSLKSVTYNVYNGDSLKGTALGFCQRVGWTI